MKNMTATEATKLHAAFVKELDDCASKFSNDMAEILANLVLAHIKLRGL